MSGRPGMPISTCMASTTLTLRKSTAVKAYVHSDCQGAGASCSGLQTVGRGLANPGALGLTVMTNRRGPKPTIMATQLRMIATGLQTARQTHRDCEGHNRQCIKRLRDFSSTPLLMSP